LGRWKKGWHADGSTMTAAPRWTQGRSSRHASTKESWKGHLENTRYTVGGGFRDTWIQQHTRRNLTPGPGRYRTDREFPQPADRWNPNIEKEEIDTNKTIQERAPEFPFAKTEREVSLRARPKLSCLKASNMITQTGSKTTEVGPSPGPGQYLQFTTFGAASGGEREVSGATKRERPLKHYF